MKINYSYTILTYNFLNILHIANTDGVYFPYHKKQVQNIIKRILKCIFFHKGPQNVRVEKANVQTNKKTDKQIQRDILK